jgi:hypothetical protein
LLLLLFISLGIGVRVEKINNRRNFARVGDNRGLSRYYPFIQAIERDVEIDEHPPDQRQRDDS